MFLHTPTLQKSVFYLFHEKLEIVNHPHHKELLNKRSELVSKCQHANKYLLNNYKANDLLFQKSIRIYAILSKYNFDVKRMFFMM